MIILLKLVGGLIFKLNFSLKKSFKIYQEKLIVQLKTKERKSRGSPLVYSFIILSLSKLVLRRGRESSQKLGL